MTSGPIPTLLRGAGEGSETSWEGPSGTHGAKPSGLQDHVKRRERRQEKRGRLRASNPIQRPSGGARNPHNVLFQDTRGSEPVVADPQRARLAVSRNASSEYVSVYSSLDNVNRPSAGPLTRRKRSEDTSSLPPSE